MDYHTMFRNLWAWIAEDPSREKHEWPGFVETGHIPSYCPACAHADQIGTGNPGDRCYYCPLEDGAKKSQAGFYDDRACLGGLYTLYLTAAADYRSYREMMASVELIEEQRLRAVKAAEAIRDLEWKD